MIPLHYDQMAHEATKCLERLIRIPSLSRNEGEAADFLEDYLRQKGSHPHRHGNNIWCVQEANDDTSDDYLADYAEKTEDAEGTSTEECTGATGGAEGTQTSAQSHSVLTPSARPTLLLNAHIDTVKPASGWQRDPFSPTREGDRLYGLGSNDCGGGLVTLMQVFLALRNERLPYRLVFLASAEEEVSGKEGIEAVLPFLPPIDVAIVGEPTQLQPAIAEKGLMVLDCTAFGVSGHAARNEGVNAIYQALSDIEWFRTYQFPQVSPLLGAVKMSVTMIEAGSQHNVVPDRCNFVVDVRSNECYSNPELLGLIRSAVRCEVKARSTRLSSSRIPTDHPLIERALSLGLSPFGSPTLSDQALMSFPSFKLGPGDSARSHTADEYICLSELRQAVELYVRLIRGE